MKKFLLLLCVGVTLLWSSQVFATSFTEDFEGNLNQWTGKDGGAHHGEIVVDPLDLSGSNHAMNFTQLIGAGDIFTSLSVFSAGSYVLSFDYLGYAVDGQGQLIENDDTGGYVGISQGYPDSHRWLYATGTASGALDVLIDDGLWHSYTFNFTSTFDFHLMLEDFSGSGGIAGDAYFDNFNLAPVPEPATMLLFGLGILGLAGASRKKLGK
ncbi:MAG: PEP-CTERM sorting domain-containing protein [Desulfobacula sp.]|uniref:PEP-CTERM sorting domain-containing protein n=1 Tax=Desulfobacula sp. TaxID=2593537 RepID=UPI0025BEC224|nr:PEP-CTERM sorting domain-containing protein [Desulfobacula sp.]MCD4720754.1 PEP-CTERM sorting domain-containing protein [Desulfobacula sp.]